MSFGFIGALSINIHSFISFLKGAVRYMVRKTFPVYSIVSPFDISSLSSSSEDVIYEYPADGFSGSGDKDGEGIVVMDSDGAGEGTAVLVVSEGVGVSVVTREQALSINSISKNVRSSRIGLNFMVRSPVRLLFRIIT